MDSIHDHAARAGLIRSTNQRFAKLQRQQSGYTVLFPFGDTELFTNQFHSEIAFERAFALKRLSACDV